MKTDSSKSFLRNARSYGGTLITFDHKRIIYDLVIKRSKVLKERQICGKPIKAVNKISNNVEVKDNYQQTPDHNLTRNIPDNPTLQGKWYALTKSIKDAPEDTACLQEKIKYTNITSDHLNRKTYVFILNVVGAWRKSNNFVTVETEYSWRLGTRRWLAAKCSVKQELKVHITAKGMSEAFCTINRNKLLHILSDTVNEDEWRIMRIIRFLLNNTLINMKISEANQQHSFTAQAHIKEMDWARYFSLFI